MNFSVKKLNDASVLVLLECDTIQFKGLMLYPLPFLGENDDDNIAKLVQEHPTNKEEGSGEDILDYHVIFNLTPYSEAVAHAFMAFGFRTPKGMMALSCNKNVQDYIVDSVRKIPYTFLPATDQIRDIFDTIEPLKLAKFATLLRSKV